MNAVPFTEEALLIACQGDTMVGVLSQPAASASSDLAMVVVVGGPQYRAGSHRQFTQLAREAAAQGTPVLRFDYRGMGDSTGTLRNFEDVHEDIAAAVDALQQRLPAVRRVVLWGLCDGASASLMYWERSRDSRIAGMCLLNPWVRSATTLARAHVKHYYWNRLRQGEFWRKLLGGRVALKALRDLAGNLRAAKGAVSPTAERDCASLSFQERMLRGAEGFARPLLWVLSGQDYTAKEFVELAAQAPRWQAVLEGVAAVRLDMAVADHTFSGTAQGQQLMRTTQVWLHSAFVDHLKLPDR